MPMADAKGLYFTAAADPAIPPWLVGDPTRIRQILLNLGSNAVKFTDADDDHNGLVVISAELVGPVEDDTVRIRLRVRDTGIGIPADAVPTLFAAFTQAERSTTRRFGGTGLGLTICKQLAELMGGSIDVASEPGAGSTFTATLPLAIDRQRPLPPPGADVSGLRLIAALAHVEEIRSIYADAFAQWGLAHEYVDGLASLQAALIAAAERGETANVVVLSNPISDAEVELFETWMRDDGRVSDVRIVRVDRNRSSGLALVQPNKVVMAGYPVRMSMVRHAIAVAVGRASPEVRYDDDGVTKVKARRAPSVDEALASGELILVAEDNLTNQDVIRRQLNLLGYACEIADDGAAALTAWRDRDYALLLTDCHMPEMDGFELTAAIRDDEDSGPARAPIIAITANALQGEAERCLAAGMDDYLAKPLEMPKLKAALEKWVPGGAGGAASATGTAPDAAAADDGAGGNGAGAAIDPAALKDVFGDDAETFREILQDFVDPATANVAEIKDAWQLRSAGDVRAAAHKLKSSSRSVGAHKLADACVALETAGKDSDWDTIDTLSPELDRLMAHVADYIRAL